MSKSNESVQRLEQNLRRQQKHLEDTLSSVVRQGRETASEDPNDSADQAVLSYQRELLYRQGSTGHAQLTLIRRALARIADGTYGECLHCGETIGAKRLEALPWTPNCIQCQEKIENGQIEDPVRAA